MWNFQNWIWYCLKTRGTQTLYLYSLLVDGFPLILPWIQRTKFSGYATDGDGDADLHSIRGRVHIMHPVWCSSTGPASCQHPGRLLARPGLVPGPLLLDPASRMSLLGTLWLLVPSPNNRVCFPWTLQSPSKKWNVHQGAITRDKRKSRRQPIPRVLRKTLFRYDIWRPSVFPVPDEKCNKDKSSTGTKCTVLNSRSINNKEDSILELIVDNCLDFLALTETWCNENSTVSLGQITPLGYSVIHTHRPTRGDGVALIFRDTYKAKRVKTRKYTNFENQTVSLSLGTNYLHVTTIYILSGIFSSELNEQISDKLLSLTGKHVILGDFNFRINDPTDTHVAKFKALTEQFNLIQHVSIPTHDAGNTLDLVLTRNDLSVSSIFTDHSVKSGHSAVLFTIYCASPGVVKKSITYRKWKSIDVSSVRALDSDAFEDFAYQNIDTAVRTYNSTLADIIDNHAPQKSRIVTVRADKPCYTAELSQEKRLQCKYVKCKMINCSITSRLDYCNNLLYGAKGYNISQLQLCQNNAARMLSLHRKFDHITPVLKDLHWLPVEQRIEYKVLLLTYKALHGKAPAYISQLLSLYTPTRTLRSENKNLLRVPRCR